MFSLIRLRDYRALLSDINCKVWENPSLYPRRAFDESLQRASTLIHSESLIVIDIPCCKDWYHSKKGVLTPYEDKGSTERLRRSRPRLS